MEPYGKMVSFDKWSNKMISTRRLFEWGPHHCLSAISWLFRGSMQAGILKGLAPLKYVFYHGPQI